MDMYEARQNKEKVNRRIDAGEVRQKAKLKVGKMLHHSSIIQKVSFQTFISHMLSHSIDTNKNLCIYTHVLSDGWGDISMLNNLASIMERHQRVLGINKIIKLGTIEPDENGECDNKKEFMENLGFTEAKIEYSDRRGTPASCTRVALAQKENNWEIQSPVYDIQSNEKRKQDPKFTVLTEMGAANDESMYSTLASRGQQNETGLILPSKSLLSNHYTGSLPDGLLDFLGMKEDDFRKKSVKLDKITIINVRRKDLGAYRPQIDIVYNWAKNKDLGKILLLGKSQIAEEHFYINICPIERMDGELLHHIINKLPQDGLVIAGGEGLFSEALGLGESNVLFGARYPHQFEALLYYASKYPSLIDEKKLIKEISSLDSLTEQREDESRIDKFDQFKILADLLRNNDINSIMYEFVLQYFRRLDELSYGC